MRHDRKPEHGIRGPPSRGAGQMRVPSGVVGGGLMFAAVVIACFHALAFRHVNRAPEVDLSRYRQDRMPRSASGLDQCLLQDGKLTVAAWFRGDRASSNRGGARLFVLDRAEGRAFALSTVPSPRDDVRGSPARGLDDDRVSVSGSIDLAVAGRHMRAGTVLLAVEDAKTRSLVPLPCEVAWTR